MTDKERAREEAREIYERRHDPGEWSEEAVPVTIRPVRTSVVSCRLPSEEFDALEVAAKAVGESLSEYVRKALELRRTGSPVTVGLLATSLGATTMQVTSYMPAAWTETPTSLLDDLPTNRNAIRP